MTLLKKDRDGKFLELPKNESIVFLPSKGFLINFRQIKNPWGTYQCREEEGQNTLSVILVPRKGKYRKLSEKNKICDNPAFFFNFKFLKKCADDEVRAFPSETKVYLNPSSVDSSRPADTFECHAKRKILISFDFDTKEVPVKIDYKYVSADEFPYKAIAKVPVQSQQQLKKDWAIVRCQTADTLRTLHIWEYSPKVTAAPTTLEIHYDNLNHQYLCCASNTINHPKFQMVFCGDKVECNIRKGFYVTAQNAYSTKHFAPEGCASIPVNVDGFGEIR